MNQKKMPIVDSLKSYSSSERISMHVPGHKGGRQNEAIPELSELFDEHVLKKDITEIEGFDDYHEPDGIILEAERLAAELFGADETYFLVNGTTSGMMAAVASAALEGEPVLVARDCHKSVIRGLILSGAEPVYITPHIDEETGLPAGISCKETERILSQGGIKALIVSNPSYYGTSSDLRKLVETAHRYGTAVIADEAHGAQLRFTEQDEIPDAMSAGADISVQSTHKMLGSITQSSMLHVQGTLINRERLRYNIKFMTSTSPSYLMLGALDAVRHRMAESGTEIWKNILDITHKYAEKISELKGMKCIEHFTGPDGEYRKTDGCRLLISAVEAGISGKKLAGILLEKYGIDVEMSDERYVLAVMGSCTSETEIQVLYNALNEISAGCSLCTEVTSGCVKSSCGDIYGELSAAAFAAGFNRNYAVSPRKAVYSRHDLIEIAYAEGRISAVEIAVYPPGIPFIVPGERITSEVIEAVYRLLEKGVHIHGIQKRVENGDIRYMIQTAEDETQAMLFNCIF